MDHQAWATVDASRERLRQLVEAISDDDLARPIEGDWTTASMLAHIAFWDRRTAWLVRRCQEGAAIPSLVDTDSVNEAALPQWRLIPPRLAAMEALEAAAEIDGLLPSLSAEQLATLRDSRVNYDRSGHRNEHIDQIERILGQD